MQNNLEDKVQQLRKHHSQEICNQHFHYFINVFHSSAPEPALLAVCVCVCAFSLNENQFVLDQMECLAVLF